jgi:hypothetical protein
MQKAHPLEVNRHDAAGSLIRFFALLWVYPFGLIFTHVYARRYGSGVVAAPQADLIAGQNPTLA